MNSVGALDAPARRVDRGLQVLPEREHPRPDLHMALRLHHAAHHAERDERLAVLASRRRE